MTRPAYIAPREVLRRYLSDQLDAAQTQAFEQSVHSVPGELAEQLRLARELGRTESHPGYARARWRFGRIAGFALAIAVVLASLVAVLRPTPSDVVALTRDASTAALDNAIATVVSVPDQMSDDSQRLPAVRLDPRAERLDLQPQLRTADLVDWSVELAATDGSRRWRAQTLGSLRPVLSVPAKELSPGDYELRVTHIPLGGGERHLRVFRFELWQPPSPGVPPYR
ncbi:MAG: hypothetical protein AAFX85_16950 [Pseudomonadota bacterium]